MEQELRAVIGRVETLAGKVDPVTQGELTEIRSALERLLDSAADADDCKKDH